MNKRLLYFSLLFVFIGGISPLFSQLTFSGVLDSTVNYTAGGEDASDHSWGIEEYANIRLRLRTGDMAVFNAAFNLIAISGDYLKNANKLESLRPLFYPNLSLAVTPFVYGQNYAAALELERLYFRINGDKVDTEAGLVRMPFGYGNVWGSMDFLNPRNPLAINARPRGVLGANFSFFPSISSTLMLFGAASENLPLSKEGGFIPGLMFENHWDKASLQALYAFETPFTTSKSGLHRFGLALKADIVVGFVVDALYTLDPDNTNGENGLSFGAGFDYSFFGGDLVVLFEYLYNGKRSATAAGFGGNFSNNHYLNGTFVYQANDHTSFTLSTIICFDDLSFQPVFTVNYELFQGFALNLSAIVPLDPRDKGGELGPVNEALLDGIIPKTYRWASIFAGARLRF